MASEASKYIPFLDPNREGGKFMSEDIGTDTVLAEDIAPGAVDTEELKDGAATTPKMADAPNGVSTVKINDVAVTTAKIADANVTLAKIANGTGLSVIGRSANTVGVNADIVGTDGQVLRVAGTALGFGAIVAAGIAANAVETAKIADANVTTVKIADVNVTTAKIADAAITQPKVKTKAVVALADADATLTATQMVDSGIFTITPTVARTLTTDTAANLVAAMAGYQVGTWFEFTIVCLAAFAVTLAAGTGITIVGSAVANNVSATFKARIDSATAVTIYRL